MICFLGNNGNVNVSYFINEPGNAIWGVAVCRRLLMIRLLLMMVVNVMISIVFSGSDVDVGTCFCCLLQGTVKSWLTLPYENLLSFHLNLLLLSIYFYLYLTF